MRHSHGIPAALTALLVMTFFSTARADDWPQWLGPRRDSIWREQGLAAAIPAASAVPIAICSGARRHEIEPLVDRFNVRHHFQTIVSADDVRIAKPDPEGYRKACEILSVAPHEAVTIEDSPRGIAAAKAAGVRVIAVGHSFKQDRLSEADEFIKAVGDLKLEHLLK
jgi:beta-phosphoglucomutase-like phosphatase (HAD superfamily)